MAMFVPDISVPLGIAGSTGSTSVSFILPSLFYLKLSPAPTRSKQKVLALALFIVGCMFLIVSTVVTLIDAAKEDDNDVDLGFVCNRTLLKIERGRTTASPPITPNNTNTTQSPDFLRTTE